MRVSVRGVLPPVVLIAAFLLLASSVQASAGDYSGTTVIDASMVNEFRMDNSDGRTLDISYRFHVIEGPPLSIYFVSAEARPSYKEDFHPAWSTLNTTDASKEWEWSGEGVFFLVVEVADNSTDETTTFEFDVSWYPRATTLQVLVVVLVILGAVVAVVLVWRRGRGRATGQ